NNPLGMGADRWVVTGFRDAFESAGHKADFFTEKDNLRGKLETFRPDIFITNIDIFRLDPKAADHIKAAKTKGLKVLFNAGENFLEHATRFRSLTTEGIADMFYTTYADEVMAGFEALVGRPAILIPLAANSKIHFPVSPDTRYAADISFIGARLKTKEHIFRNVLLPLRKKYRVDIYGPGWTTKDKILRALSGFGRRTKLFGLADWANQKRISVPLELERVIYSSSKICLNIHEYYPEGHSKNLSNEREFKIPACGGFQISDAVLGLERFFIPDKEIVISRDASELISKIEYYVSHDAEREAVRKAGIERAVRFHTYDARVVQIMDIYKTL
ncbi:MAG: glycosyltransferase, partial [Patescibacteria group bacterium]